MDPNCPDPQHVQDWVCPTCDATPHAPAEVDADPPSDPTRDAADWIIDPETGAHS